LATKILFALIQIMMAILYTRVNHQIFIRVTSRLLHILAQT